MCYRHSPHTFHLGFLFCQCMFQELERDDLYWLQLIKIRHLRTHILLLQILLRQSTAFLQAIVLLHFGHVFPPQSTSVSSWFFILSLHVSGAEMREPLLLENRKNYYLRIHMLFLHTLLTQSEAFLQAIVLLHFRHIMPPQSMSVSSWFLILSLHVWRAEISQVVTFETLKC